MAEEKEKGPQAEEKEDDPLAELLFEEEDPQKEDEEIISQESGASGKGEEESTEESAPEEKQEKGDSEEESLTDEKATPESGSDERDSGVEKDSSQKEESQAEDDDPLAEILGEEELEEESLKSAEEIEETEEKKADEEADEEEAAPRKGILGLILLLLAVLVPLILLGAGLATLWYLYQNPPLQVSKVEAKPPLPETSKKSETPLTTSPIAVEDRKILLLKNFLIPYRRETGEFVFVKAKVLLYFANSKEYEIARRNETLFREEIYRLFKNTPLYVWESKRGAEVLRREIKAYLTKKKIAGVIPEDLEVTGYILK